MSRFETEKCSRCQGTGKFSYCEIYGDTCFKCRGKKLVRTKRGQAALNYLAELLSIDAIDLKIGQVVSYDGKKQVIKDIQKVNGEFKSLVNGIWQDDSENRLNVIFESSSLNCFKTTKFQRIASQNDIDKALNYQNQLTKQGNLKKTKVN